MVIRVFTPKGRRLTFDLEGYELYRRRRWCSTQRYIMRYPRAYLHRELMGAKKGQLVDHINGDKLDNRRCNLRFATRGQNGRNSLSKRPYKGAYLKPNGSYEALARINSKTVYLGLYATAQEAHEAYCKFVKAFDPEFFCDGKKRQC